MATAPVDPVCQPPPATDVMTCFAMRRDHVEEPGSIVRRPAVPVPGVTPAGYGPADLVDAYNLPTGPVTGRTVAIVNAYDNPTAERDLAVYRSQYRLPPCTSANRCFTKVNQTGGARLPAVNAGWAGEISLDVDMVSAICPTCQILLVEADSARASDLYRAVDYAAAHAKFVSPSWGAPEPSTIAVDEAHFRRQGVVITASSGDTGTGALYPATSRYVTATGGTTLRPAGNDRGWAEVAWSGAGSGCSIFSPRPPWQRVATGCRTRAEVDVSAVADPATGVAVYQTTGFTGWTIYGGTSVSAPLIAAVFALAGVPASGSYAASFPYLRPAALFDVTSGSNNSCGPPMCTAGPGWDGPTGLGTPNGISAFSLGPPGAVVAPTVADPGPQASTVGRPVSLTLRASGGTGPFTWAVNSLPPGLRLNQNTGVVTGTPTRPTMQWVIIRARDSNGSSARARFMWTVRPPVS